MLYFFRVSDKRSGVRDRRYQDNLQRLALRHRQEHRASLRLDKVPTRRGRKGSKRRSDAGDEGKDRQICQQNIWLKNPCRECKSPLPLSSKLVSFVLVSAPISPESENRKDSPTNVLSLPSQDHLVQKLGEAEIHTLHGAFPRHDEGSGHGVHSGNHKGG